MSYASSAIDNGQIEPKKYLTSVISWTHEARE
jgi:hypothetical protein